MKRVLIMVMSVSMAISVGPSAEARPRRRSGQQQKKLQEEMQYRQQEMMRYQSQVAAKEREIYLSYDENGNGKLEGVELAKFKQYMTAVENGKEPNPLASIPPPGQGPRPTDKK